MRFLIEIAVFLVIALLAVAVIAAVLWICGAPLGLRFSHAAWYAGVGLAFVLPGAMNVWIMLRGTDRETGGERALAGIRGLCMLVCAAAVVAPFVCSVPTLRPFVLTFSVSFALNIATLPVDDYLHRRRLRQAGLLAEE